MLEAGAAHDMEWDLFQSIIDRVMDEPKLHGTTIVLWLNGEPLLHPRYADMIKYVSDRKLRFYITTNGMIWKDEVYNQIMTPGSPCYQIIFSLDGMPIARSQSIELARPGSNRQKILDTIYRAIRMKHAMRSTLDIAVKLSMRGQDWGEVEAYISYWLSEGVDFVCIGRTLNDEDTPGMRVYPCQYSDNSFMVIKSDGALTLCAYNTKMTNDRSLSVGTVANKTPLLELYNSWKYTDFRRKQAIGVFEGPCRTCGFAYTGMGMTGKIKLRDTNLIRGEIFFSQDYYNSFYSLKERRKEDSYYAPGFEGEVRY
jgi:MoaA/NifB/PqqE/SkfB family radical SAM enzyme